MLVRSEHSENSFNHAWLLETDSFEFRNQLLRTIDGLSNYVDVYIYMYGCMYVWLYVCIYSFLFRLHTETRVSCSLPPLPLHTVNRSCSWGR